MTEVQQQRIEHLYLQGFSPEDAARMQNVPLSDVLRVYVRLGYYEKKVVSNNIQSK